MMEYNIDILVAGCNTTCMHCYVNGGKFPAMKMEDFFYCIEKLKAVFAMVCNGRKKQYSFYKVTI